MCVSGDCDLLKEITAEVERMLRVRGYEIPEQMSGEAQFYLDKLEINRIHLELNNDSLGNRLSKIIQMLESLDD